MRHFDEIGSRKIAAASAALYRGTRTDGEQTARAQYASKGAGPKPKAGDDFPDHETQAPAASELYKMWPVRRKGDQDASEASAKDAHARGLIDDDHFSRVMIHVNKARGDDEYAAGRGGR
jgi:hypothetical protein